MTSRFVLLNYCWFCDEKLLLSCCAARDTHFSAFICVSYARFALINGYCECLKHAHQLVICSRHLGRVNIFSIFAIVAFFSCSFGEHVYRAMHYLF